MEVDANRPQNDLRGYVAVLRRRKWWVVATTVVFVGLAAFHSSRTAKLYATTSQIVIVDPANSLTLGGGGSSANPDRYIATQLQVIDSQSVSDDVAHLLGSRFRRIGAVAAQQVGPTDVVSIRVESTSPSIARDAANAYAQAYVNQQRGQAAAALNGNAAELRSLAKTAQAHADTANRKVALMARGPDRDVAASNAAVAEQNAQDLRGRADQLDIQAAFVRGGGSKIVARATLPRAPISPNPRRDASLAAVLGLIVGLAFAFGRDYLDDAVRVDELERRFPTPPVLASVPAVDDWRDPKAARVVSLEQPHSTPAEAYRSLRTSVEFVGLGQPLKIILITSPAGLEGKSAMVANLAVSFATAGSRVVVVDCDLRRPRQHEFFGTPNIVGLTSVLVERASLDEALTPVVRLAGGNLVLLSSGPLVDKPSEMLRTKRFGQVLNRLAQRADYVLIDSPPVLSVTDALVASRWADGIVCVVREKLSTNRRLAKALERLGQSTTPLVGLVVNGVRSLASSGTYYPQSAHTHGKGGGRRRLRFGRRRKQRAVLTYGITDWQRLMTDKASDGATEPSNGRNGAGVVEQGSTAATDSEAPKGE